jgi:hypothetical protein
MQSQKPPVNLESLLELAETSSEEAAPLNEAQRFVTSFGITEGDVRVDNYIIWYYYVKWTKKPFKRRYFFQLFNKIFKRRVNGNGAYYHLDPTPFDLSEDNLWRMKRFRSDEENKRRAVREQREKVKKEAEDISRP